VRVLTNTETAAREMLDTKVQQGLMTEADAIRLFNWGFRIALTTLGNWRHRNATPEAIEDAISRRTQAAKMRRATARTQNQKHLAARDLVLAELFNAVWQGMQRDAAVYATR
jgi:hypothetical protein